MPAVRHTLLPHWLGLCDVRCENPPVDLGALKQALIKRQLNSRGWRLYLDYGDALFECLGRHLVGKRHMLGLQTKGTGHATAGGLDKLKIQIGDKFQ